MFVKQSMINLLSNPINRNRSAAKISKVMSSSLNPTMRYSAVVPPWTAWCPVVAIDGWVLRRRGEAGRAESHNGGDAEGPLTSSPEEQSHLTFYRFSGLFCIKILLIFWWESDSSSLSHELCLPSSAVRPRLLQLSQTGKRFVKIHLFQNLSHKIKITLRKKICSTHHYNWPTMDIVKT